MLPVDRSFSAEAPTAPAGDAAPLGADSLRPWLTSLIGGVAVGEELLGWKLVHIDTDESTSYVFERPGSRVEIALSPRDDRAPRFAWTRSFNLGYYVARLPGRPLPADAVPLVKGVARLIARHDSGAAAQRFAQSTMVREGGEITEVEVESLLCPTTIDGYAYYTANPYVGCLIGCGFCYAQARVSVARRMAGLVDRPWGRYVLVKRNAAEVLDRELEAMGPRPVVFSPLVADVYQSVERRTEVTRRCLEVLARRGVRVYVLTRASLVLRDLDLFARIPGATVGFSIPTDRDDIRRAYEPRAATIDARFAALAALKAAGVRTVAVVQPILEMNVERLAERLASTCDAVRVDFYRPSDLGGAPLLPVVADAPPPPADDRAVREALVAALRARGVSIWETHVPP